MFYTFFTKSNSAYRFFFTQKSWYIYGVTFLLLYQVLLAVYICKLLFQLKTFLYDHVRFIITTSTACRFNVNLHHTLFFLTKSSEFDFELMKKKLNELPIFICVTIYHSMPLIVFLHKNVRIPLVSVLSFNAVQNYKKTERYIRKGMEAFIINRPIFPEKKTPV